ncbi:hypothetical protein [Rhodoferax ferrireducens]|uniref:hypothetical protein n=1 Tax=Rhodoferax ferrireducens TaxID=192843 RepID=UPI000E0DC418|nr:hypothetical protein [Rhodoferax ferrireducens]
MTKLFDIKLLAIAALATMAVRDASGEAQVDEAGEPLTITLYGPGSKQHQKARHAAEERNSTRVLSRMQGRAGDKQSAADKAAENAEFLAACTVSFNGFGCGDLTGHELFKAVYADLEIGHIADDAMKFLAERANFLKVPAKS